MSQQLTIPCPTPNCGAQIPIDTQQLLQGAQFVCPNCHGSVGLAPESRPVVEETMQKFETLKKDLLRKKTQNRMS